MQLQKPFPRAAIWEGFRKSRKGTGRRSSNVMAGSGFPCRVCCMFLNLQPQHNSMVRKGGTMKCKIKNIIEFYHKDIINLRAGKINKKSVSQPSDNWRRHTDAARVHPQRSHFSTTTGKSLNGFSQCKCFDFSWFNESWRKAALDQHGFLQWPMPITREQVGRWLN